MIFQKRAEIESNIIRDIYIYICICIFIYLYIYMVLVCEIQNSAQCHICNKHNLYAYVCINAIFLYVLTLAKGKSIKHQNEFH